MLLPQAILLLLQPAKPLGMFVKQDKCPHHIERRRIGAGKHEKEGVACDELRNGIVHVSAAARHSDARQAEINRCPMAS